MVEVKIYYPVKDIDALFENLKEISREIGAYKFDEIRREIEISTAPSLLSWGENIKILVDGYQDGVVVSIIANPRMPVNITSNPQRFIDFIAEKLNETFGEGEYIE